MSLLWISVTTLWMRGSLELEYLYNSSYCSSSIFFFNIIQNFNFINCNFKNHTNSKKKPHWLLNPKQYVLFFFQWNRKFVSHSCVLIRVFTFETVHLCFWTILKHHFSLPQISIHLHTFEFKLLCVKFTVVNWSSCCRGPRNGPASAALACAHGHLPSLQAKVWRCWWTTIVRESVVVVWIDRSLMKSLAHV